MDGWAGLGSVHRALETIRRVQWLVTPRTARTHGDPPRRRERLEIRSLAGSQAPLYFTRLSRERRGEPESKVHTGTDISVLAKKIVASLNIPRNCDYAKFAPSIEAELSLRRV